MHKAVGERPARAEPAPRASEGQEMTAKQSLEEEAKGSEKARASRERRLRGEAA